MKRYNEVSYWNTRKNPNVPMTDKEIRIHIFRNLSPYIGEAKRILDFGPGVGRIFPLYTKAERVEVFDITQQWKTDILNKANRLKLKKFNMTFAKTIGTLPYSDNEFDVAVAMSVLMHQTPSNIEGVMSELCRVASKVAVGTYYDPKIPFNTPSSPLDKTKYNHPYFDICRRRGWEVFEVNNKANSIFIYFCYGVGNENSNCN